MLDTSDSKDEVLIQYLLNELSQDENETLEDEMALDDELSERLQVVEMLLIDSYVLQEMSLEQRHRFEEGFLLFPENRDKVEDARIFRESLARLREEKPAPQPAATATARSSWFTSLFRWPILAPTFAVLALLLLGAAVFLLMRREKPEVVNRNSNSSENTNQFRALQNENNNNGNSQPVLSHEGVPELPTPAPKTSPSTSATIAAQKKSPVQIPPATRQLVETDTLVGGQIMGTDPKDKPELLTIPRDAKKLRLDVELTKTEITDSRRKILIEIQNDKMKRVAAGQATPVRISGPAQQPPRYKLSVSFPIENLKSGEIYYLAIPDEKLGRHRTTPFIVQRAD